MPSNGKRFPERSRARLSKQGQVIARTEPKTVATSVLLEPDAKIKQPRIEIEGVPDEKTHDLPKQEKIKTQKEVKKIQNVKKEEPTPENNDVKTDSKE